MAIKAILWDFANVLCLPIEGRGHDFLSHALGVPAEALERYFQGALSKKANLGEISSRAFFGIILQDYGVAEDHLALFFDYFLSSFMVNEPLIDFIKTLRGTTKIGLLSNYSDQLRMILEEKFKIADLFDDIVISSEVNLMKPDEAIYRLALQRLGVVAPQQAIFVDDLIENVEAAAALGMHAIQYQNSSQVIREVSQFLGGWTSNPE